MRLALALHNPEEMFDKSDYYPFIQRLFDKNLYLLRPDITIISFNYDCYLEYLMLRACRQRQKLSPDGVKLDDLGIANITSGFFDPPSSFDWANHTQFKYFKLHGSIAYGSEKKYGYETLFEVPHVERLKRFQDKYFTLSTPPVVFPWELINRNGGFIDQEKFIFVKENEAGASEKDKGYRLYQHFKAMWEGAQWAIEHADKISFVGLSMHPYLESGFRFLLRHNRKKVEVVLANNEKSAYQALRNLLNQPEIQMKWTKSRSEQVINDESFKDAMEHDYVAGITVRDSFEDFIKKEMD